MSYQGFILSSSQTFRQNRTQLIFQGRLCDGRRFHWTVTRPALVFFIDRDNPWTPAGAFRKKVELMNLRGKPVDALYFSTTSDLTQARQACESRNIATYEADINLTARFLMERFIKCGVSFESQPVKKANGTHSIFESGTKNQREINSLQRKSNPDRVSVFLFLFCL